MNCRLHTPCTLLIQLLCLFVFILNARPAQAQLYNFKTFSLDEGLSQSEITCMLEDSRGYLWLGTAGGGICQFDGKNFQAFEQKDGVPGQLITSLAEDKKGNIIIGATWGGLCSYNGKKFSILPTKELIQTDHFDQIGRDDQDNLVLCTRGSIALFDGEYIRVISSPVAEMKENSVFCTYRDHKGILWLGTQNGIFIVQNKQLHFLNGNTNRILSITGDETGNIWFADANSKIYKLSSVNNQPVYEKCIIQKVDSLPLSPLASVTGIHSDKRHQFWITTSNDGIYKYFKGESKHFDVNSGLPVNNIGSLLEDRSGCFWFGTNGSGLVRFMDQTFTYYDNLTGFHEKDIFGLCCDHKNTIWAGSSTKGVFSYDGINTTSYNAVPEMKGFVARTIYCDKKGILWFGGPQGIRQYDGHHFRILSILPKSDNLNTAVFCEDSYGNMWIGTRGTGAYRYDGHQAIHFGQAEGLLNPYVYSICEDNAGAVWLGTGNELYRYAHEVFRHFGSDAGISNPYIGSLVKDKFGHIWMGTDNGVAVYDGKNFHSISTAEGLSSGTIYLLNIDDFGNIWVGTNKGLDEIILNTNGQIKWIKNYGKSEGFRGIECNSRATCIDNSGNLWFGTIKGIIRYSPGEEREFDELPAIHISNVRLYYENPDWNLYCDSIRNWDRLPVNVKLPYDKNHITFDFHAINKTSPEKIKYDFMLKGFDKDWSPATETPFATYSNLPPGIYVFRVRAANKRDEWNETPAEFSFIIQQPFWNTWWFISMCILAIGGCIYAYNSFRKKKQLEEKEELEKIIHSRTSELIRQKEEKEVLLKEIHHRVKNNLQVINSLISIQSSFIEDPKSLDVFEECKNRIRAISLIHEKLYNSEDFGRINIKDYIQMLVQNMIETYNIDKSISLSLDLKVEYLNLNTTVPLGLLLNEIISNSFKYAFSDQEKGEIVIRLNTTQDQNTFVLIIGDNGHGYAGDPFHKQESMSLGLELVRILSEQLNGQIEKIPMNGTYYKLIFKSLKN
ncbi:MAG: two-component regulator propeller domain-containing protein [Bacteroidia bacterium]